MNLELSRRTFIKRAGQAGGVVMASGSLGSLIAACGNTTTSGPRPVTPGATTVAAQGLMNPALLQWGADYVSGAPYVFQDPSNPNHLIGFEVDIANAIANLMSIEQKMVEVCYANLEQALEANQIDMIMNGWEKTSDRLKTELFSVPYYRYGQQIIVRKDDTRFASVTNPSSVAVLAGMSVGTGAGYKAQVIMEQYNSTVTSSSQKINIVAYTGNIAFSDLVQHKLDAFFLDNPIAVYYVLGTGPGATAIPQLKLLGDPINYDNYYCAFKLGNTNATVLLPEINQAFAILKKNGALKAIYQHWQMWTPAAQATIGIM
ncbi:MAG: ABC transporter substrate-binding protein [Ktedonobacteraceae bacterium]